MKLPNGDTAIIDLRKLRNYCLSMDHPRGRHKAYVFGQVLRLTASESEILQGALNEAASKENASPGASDKYGDRYIIDFEMEHDGRRAKVRSSWIIRTGETAPRFVTCFVL
ncbi:MAG: DUF6883 domain-containing protein [Terracidiphilus sp.]